MLRGGIIMSIEDFPEISSQEILVGIILVVVGRLCVLCAVLGLARSADVARDVAETAPYRLP